MSVRKGDKEVRVIRGLQLLKFLTTSTARTNRNEVGLYIYSY